MEWKWTPDAIAAVRALWTEGATAKEIADTIGAPSRNAVIGKLNHLGLWRQPGRPRRTRRETVVMQEASGP